MTDKPTVQLSFATLVLVTAFCFAAVASASEQAAGPLSVHPANPRYFTDGSGKAIYLTGWYPGYMFQDYAWGETKETHLDYAGYLEHLKKYNHNLIRMWVVEHTKWKSTDLYLTTPMPWLRTGPGNALDGGLRFDLMQFNQAYFDRLRSRVIAAGEHGIYVAVMLFQGWSIEKKHDTDPWPSHPMHAANNVNSIDGDRNKNGQGEEVHTLQDSAITAIQKAYVRKVIDILNDLDNVIYEISNESGVISKDWQYALLDYIKGYEASKPKRHPLGMTGFYEPTASANAMLSASSADWIGPRAMAWSNPSDPWISDPPVADGSKVSIADSDHILGADATINDPVLGRRRVWKSFMRGHHPIQAGGGTPSSLGGDPNDPETDHPAWEIVWRAMGHARSYALKMNLAAMPPNGDLSSTKYALANPGSEYLVYQPEGGALKLNATAGTYSFEWFNVSKGVVEGTGTVTVGHENRSFRPPFTGEALLYLNRRPNRGPTE